MIGVLGISPKEAYGLTYRVLVRMYLARMLDNWDRATPVMALLQNILCGLSAIGGGRVQPLTPNDFHPIRASGKPGGGHRLYIGPESFDTLRLAADAMVRNR